MRMWRTLGVTLAIVVTPAGAAEIGPFSGEAGPSRRDLSRSQFDTYAGRYRARNFRMTDIDVYIDNGRKYAQQWRRNDGRQWGYEKDLSSSQFSDRFPVNVAQGMRPTDIEGYRNNGRTRYAAIWIENREGFRWSLYRNMTSEQFRERNLLEYNRGRPIVDFEAYRTSSGVRYAGIWYDNGQNANTFFRRNMTRTRYQERVDEKGAEGFSIVDYERYENDDGEARYAAIWQRNVPGRVIVRTNRSANSYTNLFREMNDQGYRPVDFERMGNAYGAVWMEAFPERARYAGKAALDALLDGYRATVATNSPPGVSAAIVRNGTVIWQRGDGMADVDAGREAHAETVYLLASVSKPIGATLFGRLEDRGQLADGTAVSIAANDPVRTHLPELPAAHSYQLRDLLQHYSCVGSYGTEIAIPDNDNYTNHFSSMRDAVPRYADTPLATTIVTDNNNNNVVDTGEPSRPCTPGTTFYYSNHGYGMLGSAMEAATGRPMKSLIDSELSDAFNMPSMRAKFQKRSQQKNSLRARPYRNGVERDYANTSWKVIVGGIESNAIDVARFGWLTGSARLTSAAYRDNFLLNPRPGTTRAYTWDITAVDGRRVARHNGSATGARSMLYVWPDDGLSIAVLSNQTHSRTPMRNLMVALSRVVFANP